MLYHKDIYLPEIKKENKPVKLHYTHHAIEASKSDRYGQINLPEKINLIEWDLVELETDDKTGNIQKIVVRKNYSKIHDIVLVIIPSTCRVKTVWLNTKNDNHKTLDRKKYFHKIR